jgi:hypothetical protein
VVFVPNPLSGLLDVGSWQILLQKSFGPMIANLSSCRRGFRVNM